MYYSSRPNKDGKVRKLCRKRSRSLKSWFEGREEPVQESYILLPNSKTKLESEDRIGKSFSNIDYTKYFPSEEREPHCTLLQPRSENY